MNIIKISLIFIVIFILCSSPITASADECSEVANSLNIPIAELNADGLIDIARHYELGKCVKQDWEKSAQYYQRAALGKVAKATLRLTALFAFDNRDPAAALYWAAQNPAILPKECLPAANPIKNTDGFIEELRTWPTNKLTACTYQAGLASRVMERFQQWPNGIFLQLGGGGVRYEAEVTMRVNAKNGSIEWLDSEVGRPMVSQLIKGSNEPNLSDMPSKETHLYSFWSTGISVLKEFGRPPSDEPAWSRELVISVERTARASGIPIQIGISR
jgi:hypothetical protein